MNDEQRERGRGDLPGGPAGGYASGPPSPGSAPDDPAPNGSVFDRSAFAAPTPPGGSYGTGFPGSGGYGSGGYGRAYGSAFGAGHPGWGVPTATATAEPPADPSPTDSLPVVRPPRSRGVAGVVTAALLAGLVGGGAGFGGAYALLGGDRPAAAAPALGSVPASTGTAPASNGTVAGAAAAAAPSTADIRVTTAQGVAEGSGVVLTADGAVLTNNHVVDGSSGPISVTLADGTRHTATVVGTAPSYDLAVLRTQNVSGLPAATLGRSADLQVGQQVVAIGSPQGLTGTVTTGIISALNRTVGVQGDNGQAVVYNGLQTDAPINQGNSGGPLVNLDGQVIGINSAIATAGQSSGSIGLGFTIPIDQARRVAQEILDTGGATKPVLGVQGGPPAAPQAGGGDGATIASVQDGSAAAAAGLAPGDVVTEVGDARVEDFPDLVARIGAQAPGARAALTVERGGQERTVDVTLGSTRDEAPTTSTAPSSGVLPFPNPFGR
jgi:putative serine protease PepD